MSDSVNPPEHLRHIFQRTSRTWDAAAAVWDDPVRWRFEKDHWFAFIARTKAELSAMEKLTQVIAEARRKVN